MHRSHLNSLTVLIAALAAMCALLAGVASASCGGEEEEASIAVTPAAGQTFNKGETKSVTIDNTGKVTVEIQTEDLPNPSPVKFSFVGASCLGNIAPGKSCTREIKCEEKGTGSYSATAAGGVSATITLKCD